MNRHTLNLCIISALAAVVVTALAIYLTPLKHVNLIEPTMREMDPATFWKEYRAHPDNYLFIDVRSAKEYDAVHAEGSVNMPIATLADRYKSLPRHGKQIALTCGDGRLAKIAYGYLEDYGFRNLIHITGGLQNWILEGLPVIRGGDATNTPQIVGTSVLQECPKLG